MTRSHSAAAHRLPAWLTALLLAVAVASLTAGCGEAADFPSIVDAVADCSVDQWWTLSAQVEHEQGPQAVVWVAVEAYFLLTDETTGESIADPLGIFDLARQDGSLWGLTVEPGTTPLDCSYPGEYLFVFVAEDAEGQQNVIQLVN